MNYVLDAPCDVLHLTFGGVFRRNSTHSAHVSIGLVAKFISVLIHIPHEIYSSLLTLQNKTFLSKPPLTKISLLL